VQLNVVGIAVINELVNLENNFSVRTRASAPLEDRIFHLVVQKPIEPGISLVRGRFLGRLSFRNTNSELCRVKAECNCGGLVLSLQTSFD
jgi:hypothetical protein